MISKGNVTSSSNASRISSVSDCEIPFCWFDENGGEIGDIKNLYCSESALLWASLTVGAPSRAVLIRNIKNAPAFALHKWFAIRSVLDFRNNSINPRRIFSALDPSEKQVLSYWTGMIFAKLVAEQVLGAPWMAHARLLQTEGLLQVNPSKTKSLPDLVGNSARGESKAEWHIIEAKGLQKNPSANQRQHYKDQISVIETISGVYPATRNYCITKIRSPFSVELHDPEDISEKSIKIHVTPLDLLKFYYKPFLALFGDNEGEDDIIQTDHFMFKKLICDPIHKERCCVGIAREVFDQVKEWEIEEKAGSGEENMPLKNIDVLKLIKDELFKYGDTYLGSDGIFVQLLR